MNNIEKLNGYIKMLDLELTKFNQLLDAELLLQVPNNDRITDLKRCINRSTKQKTVLQSKLDILTKKLN